MVLAVEKLVLLLSIDLYLEHPAQDLESLYLLLLFLPVLQGEEKHKHQDKTTGTHSPTHQASLELKLSGEPKGNRMPKGQGAAEGGRAAGQGERNA